MRHFIAAFIGVLLWLVPAMSLAQADGVLEGQVVNGTPGGPAVAAGTTVRLIISQDAADEGSLETQTDASGRFRFEGLETSAGLSYWPEATYLDVTYTSEVPYQFGGDQGPLQATLKVYETTGDDSAVRLNSVHLIAESFGEVLRVSEIHLMGNDGDRTFVGTPGQTGVQVPLPEQAVGLAFPQEGAEGRFAEVEGGLLDTAPVPPGTETSLVFLSYHLMVPGAVVPLERTFAYPVDTLSVLVAQPGLSLRSEDLQAMGPELFQGRQYELWVANGLAPGTSLEMELIPEAVEPGLASGAGTGSAEGAALPATTQGNQELLRWLGFALAGLAVAGAVVYGLLGRPAAAASRPPDLPADPETRRLLSDLANLEDDFKAGKLGAAAYESARFEKREAIRARWQ